VGRRNGIRREVMISVRKLRELEGVWADTTKKRADRRRSGNKENQEKQDKARKEMLRRVAEFNTALTEPTCRIPMGQTEQSIKAVDAGKEMPPSKTLHVVEDEEEAQKERERWGPGVTVIMAGPPEKKGKEPDDGEVS
jgi:hypothetical protein